MARRRKVAKLSPEMRYGLPSISYALVLCMRPGVGDGLVPSYDHPPPLDSGKVRDPSGHARTLVSALRRP